jgi:broad specificity phosphatase PhoE
MPQLSGSSRHHPAQSEEPVPGRIDVGLDEGGWRDAWAAAGVLDEKGIEAVYCSRLRRARDTARVIADDDALAVDIRTRSCRLSDLSSDHG